MLLDNETLFSDNQAITTGTIYSDNIVRFGEGEVDFLPLLVQVVVGFTKAEGLEVKVQTSETEDFTNAVDLASSELKLADLSEGARFPITRLPKGNKGYIRLAYIVSGDTAETDGKITAGVVVE